ncbi:putative Tip elongation aberrant protein 1 [Cercophora samala]|uniref:Tip elongation aberrant protein 1 n=1 Tax=Cercophora samala TaxID=330535 RepID=A0AA39ZC32_9PEZI|nr:putative Tip elongation aberrant protein 1 [Cercophora samala]
MGGLMDESRVLADLWYIEVQGSSDLRCVPIAASGRKPSARVGHRCVLAGNALCLHGGDTKMEDSDTLDDNLYLMNRGALPEPGVSPPPGRYGHSLSLVASFLVVFGGQIEGDFRNDTALFDLELLQWVEPRLADNDKLPPPPRTNHSTVVWDNKMYIFGGTNGHTWYNDIWSYDPVTNTWEYVATDTRHWKRPARREGHSAAVTGGMMCVFGGRSEMGRDLPDFWVFDLAERRWHPFGNMGGVPSPRSGHSMVVFGKHIVVVAGEPSSSTPQADREELALGYVLDTTKIRIPKTSLVVSHPSPGLNGLEIPPGLMF